LTTDKSTVWVLDSSALIAMKTIPVSDQWQVFRQMEDMVTEGEIALPRQVINELKEIAHPDVPGGLGSRHAQERQAPAGRRPSRRAARDVRCR